MDSSRSAILMTWQGIEHFQKAKEGPLEKEEPYSYYSMLNEDVTCYEPDNRDEGEIIEREAD